MSSIINASISSNGIVSTADASGILLCQSNGVNTNARAWVYFVGSTATINASYNVSSVTRGGTGLYTVNFTNAMSNTNFSAYASGGDPTISSANSCMTYIGTPTTTSQFVATRNGTNTSVDLATVNVVIFG